MQGSEVRLDVTCERSPENLLHERKRYTSRPPPIYYHGTDLLGPPMRRAVNSIDPVKFEGRATRVGAHASWLASRIGGAADQRAQPQSSGSTYAPRVRDRPMLHRVVKAAISETPEQPIRNELMCGNLVQHYLSRKYRIFPDCPLL